MKHLYNTATGELVSSATVINDVPYGMAVKESSKTGVWDSELLDFIEVATDKVLNRDDFLDLFTDEEMLSIIEAAKTDETINSSLELLNFRGRIRMSSPNTINLVNHIQSKGLLEHELRSKEVLNG